MQINSIFRDWLNRRKITDTVIEQFGLHTGSNAILGECLVIPLAIVAGQRFNKYRRSPLSDEKPKYTYDKGSHTTLYGWDHAFNKDKIVVTEGELDALVLWSANIPAVSSTSGAMTFLPEWGLLLANKEVVFCFDNDSSGGEGMVKALQVVPHAKVLFLPDRPGIKDVSDYVANGGDFNALLATAKSFETLAEVMTDRADRIAIWQSTYFHDAYIKFHKPVVTRPRVTHTNKADNVSRAKNYPIPNLLKIGRDHKVCCLWHNEKTPSMHYYESSNRLYCFGGCGRGYDAIDVYMQLNGVDFKSAVEALCK